MRVGMGTIFQNPHDRRPDHEVYTREIHLTDMAEPLGFDSVWCLEHHCTDDTILLDLPRGSEGN